MVAILYWVESHHCTIIKKYRYVRGNIENLRKVRKTCTRNTQPKTIFLRNE